MQTKKVQEIKVWKEGQLLFSTLIEVLFLENSNTALFNFLS